jgi:hypothetical protein
MSETVRLVGGPRDGQTLAINHGDTVEFPIAAPTLDFSVPTTDPWRHETALYVRSRRSPNLFVFQP